MTETTALSEFREAVATALEGSTPSPSDATVYTDMVDAVNPPAYLLVWGSPWIESSTFCLELVRLDVVCIAGRVDPAPGIATLETMVATAKNRLRAARFPQVVTQPPARFDIGGVAYLAARLTVEVKLAIPSPDAPIEGGALLTVAATLTVAGVVIGSAVIDGAASLAAVATLTVAGTVIGANVIDGAATLTAGPTLTAAGTVVAAGFTPGSVPGLIGWFDASDTASLTVSGSPARVSSWANKAAGFAAITQATSTRQAVSGVTTINGLNVLTFEPTPEAAVGYSTPDIGADINANNLTFYAVMKHPSAPDRTQHIITAWQALGGNDVTSFQVLTNAHPRIGNAWTTSSDGAGDFRSSGNGRVFTGKGAAADGYSIYMDGVRDNAATGAGIVVGPPAARTVSTGTATAGGGSTYTYYVCELLIYNVAHNDTQRNQVEAFLKAKWNTL